MRSKPANAAASRIGQLTNPPNGRVESALAATNRRGASATGLRALGRVRSSAPDVPMASVPRVGTASAGHGRSTPQAARPSRVGAVRGGSRTLRQMPLLRGLGLIAAASAGPRLSVATAGVPAMVTGQLVVTVLRARVTGLLASLTVLRVRASVPLPAAKPTRVRHGPGPSPRRLGMSHPPRSRLSASSRVWSGSPNCSPSAACAHAAKPTNTSKRAGSTPTASASASLAAACCRRPC